MWHALEEEKFLQDFGRETRGKKPLGRYRPRGKDNIEIGF